MSDRCSACGDFNRQPDVSDLCSACRGCDWAQKPRRIQTHRTKGWRLPEGTIYVGRPTRFGNPYTIRDTGSNERAVDAFRSLLANPTSRTAKVRADNGWRYVDYPADSEIRDALAGHDLACFCAPGQPCHADVLLEVAN